MQKCSCVLKNCAKKEAIIRVLVVLVFWDFILHDFCTLVSHVDITTPEYIQVVFLINLNDNTIENLLVLQLPLPRVLLLNHNLLTNNNRLEAPTRVGGGILWENIEFCFSCFSLHSSESRRLIQGMRCLTLYFPWAQAKADLWKLMSELKSSFKILDCCHERNLCTRSEQLE